LYKRLVVDFFYFLQTSKSYQKTRRFFYNFLENDSYPYKKYFDGFMMMLILISVASLVREVKHEVDPKLLFFNYYIISLIFFFEYILRLWVTSSVSEIVIRHYENDSMLSKKLNLWAAFREIVRVKFRYILSLKAIIDILAILPFFHQLRLLRIFILFRVFKLFRYARSFEILISVFSAKKFEFITLFIFASIVIVISSILVYVMEAMNPASPINTLFDAFYWSIVTIATVGYGDIVPVTDGGRIVAIIVITAGIAVLAFTTSLVVSAFNEKLDEIRETKIVNNISNTKQYYIVCGYENIAQEVVKKLLKSDLEVIVLDEDEERVNNAKKAGFVALNFDPGSVESYKKLQLDLKTQVKAIICLRENDVENVYTALTVRSLNKDVFILSLVMQEINKKKLAFAGVNEVLYAKELIGMVTREFVGQPVAFEVIHALRSELTNVNIEEIFLSSHTLKNFIYVRDLKNSIYRIVLLGVYKKKLQRFFFNPIDSTILQEGDYLLVIGNSYFIQEFTKYLNKR
jgi:voltage-gated potassium channel